MYTSSSWRPKMPSTCASPGASMSAGTARRAPANGWATAAGEGGASAAAAMAARPRSAPASFSACPMATAGRRRRPGCHTGARATDERIRAPRRRVARPRPRPAHRRGVAPRGTTGTVAPVRCRRFWNQTCTRRSVVPMRRAALRCSLVGRRWRRRGEDGGGEGRECTPPHAARDGASVSHSVLGGREFGLQRGSACPR